MPESNWTILQICKSGQSILDSGHTCFDEISNACSNFQDSKVNLALTQIFVQAGHSGRVRPGPIPNPEVKPAVAAVLLTCVSGWEAAVLASFPSKNPVLDLCLIASSANVFTEMDLFYQSAHTHGNPVHDAKNRSDSRWFPTTRFYDSAIIGYLD